MSQGLNASKSDKASISINIDGIEYATDSRGLNFVIWDKKREKVIDSVTFDFWLTPSVSRKTNYMKSIENQKVHRKFTI
jgi:hypothetical protein